MTAANILIALIALLHVYFLVLEMFFWDKPLGLRVFNQTSEKAKASKVLAANQGAHFEQYAPFSWPGGSMVVDFDGRILAQADPGPGEKVVVAPIDIGALREARTRRRGHDMRAHHRTEFYPYSRGHALAPATDPAAITIESLNARIAAAKRQVGG